MECGCEMFPYPHPIQSHAFYPQQSQPPVMYPPYMQQPPQMEEYHVHYAGPEYADFGYPMGAYYEDYEDMNGEPSTRPRLTKDQVEVLEAQFQANHKPSSVVKRQLAMQTMLSLPRVANWFQNRRAKAKQQKKQEEYESNQGQNPSPGLGRPTQQLEEHMKLEAELEPRDSPHATSSRPSTSPNSAGSHDVDALRQSRFASYASVDRLLAQQSAAQARPMSLAGGSDQLQQPPPLHPHHRSLSAVAKPQAPQWPEKTPDAAEAWNNPPQHFQDTSFDFGFGSDNAATVPVAHPTLPSASRDSGYGASITSAETWPLHLQMPRAPFHAQIGPNGDLQSPELPSPVYHDSRRGSGADALAANFGSFALGTPVDEIHPEFHTSEESPHQEEHMDLAARRKRPRPTALNSASLRSRSHGTLTATSPTVRSGFTPPAHTVRHVKSQGHSLNARFAGVRKPSSAQRSPINPSFAEAEAFHQLFAQTQGDLGHFTTQSSASATPVATPGLSINTSVGDHMQAHKADIARTYQLSASQHLTLATASPPTTPFGPEYNQYQPPPLAAPPQYASFADYTPPYSAGPLTNSSWPDAPLSTPDMTNFSNPAFAHMPRLSQGSDPGFHVHHPSGGHLSQQFMLPSDGRPVSLDTGGRPSSLSSVNGRQPEFFIQEFPKQKEEHAHAAQQLAQSRPKNYVFANTAPSDYDQA